MERWYQHLAVADEQRKDAMTSAKKRQMLRSDRTKTQPATPKLLSQLSRWVTKQTENREPARVSQLHAQRVKE